MGVEGRSGLLDSGCEVPCDRDHHGVDGHIGYLVLGVQEGGEGFFYEIFYFPTFIHTILYPLIVLYSPLFGSFSANPSLLPYAMHCVALVFVS